MASVWRRGRYWYVTIKDRNGKWKTTSSHMTHKRDADELASRLESKEIMIRRTGPDPNEDRMNGTHNRPINDVLSEWKKDIEARGNTAKHAFEQHYMAKTLFEKAGVHTLADLAPSAISGALARLRGEYDLAPSTLNSYLRAAKSFSRWLWRDGRQRADPIIGMKPYRVSVDRRRMRRALTLPEIRKLLHTADNGPALFGMSGLDRGMLYRLMLGTGLRVNEVRTLRAKHFLWNEKPVLVLIYAGYSKRRREDRQPIRDELARKLKAWIKKRRLGAEDQVFRIPDKPNLRLLKEDLAAAKIPAVDEHKRVMDLHGLRHTFITECARHFPPKVTQQLARHASITTTMAYYVHFEEQEVADMFTGSDFYDRKRQTGTP